MEVAMIKYWASIVLLILILVVVLANHYAVKDHDIYVVKDRRVQIENAKVMQSDVIEMKHDVMIIKAHLAK